MTEYSLEFIAFVERKKENEVAQVCLTLCDPMNSSLHQAPPSMGFSRQEVLEWVAISFSRESSQPRDWTQVSHIVDRHFTVWATREVQQKCSLKHWVIQANWLADWVMLLHSQWQFNCTWEAGWFELTLPFFFSYLSHKHPQSYKE